MRRLLLSSSAILLSAGCIHAGSQAGGPRPDVRMAQAQMMTREQQQVMGHLSFEQMPNSVLITYHLEGLKPKTPFQIVLHESSDCQDLSEGRSNLLAEMKVNAQGLAENTFRSDKISLVNQYSIVGNSVTIRGTALAGTTMEELACGRIEPQSNGMATFKF